MSELYEVLSWLIYTVAAVLMLAVIVAAILAGLALRFIAEFLRELGDGREIRDKRGLLAVSTTFYETESTAAFRYMSISRESQRNSSVRRTVGH